MVGPQLVTTAGREAPAVAAAASVAGARNDQTPIMSANAAADATAGAMR
jgi:hypothetical protein